MSKTRLEGYLIIDHRNSPGIPFNPAMVGKAGYGFEIPKAGGVMECATVTCCHCQRVVILNPLRDRPRGWCFKCDRYVCDNPGCNSECRPFEAVIEQEQERLFRQLAGGQF